MIAKYKKGDIIKHNDDSTLKRQILEIYYNTTKCGGYIEDIYYQTLIVSTTKDIPPPTQINEIAIDKYYTKIER